ncbi:DNA cytosine methyltransferase [Salmonella enterica]|nr:DNA cytosine methyltransferase [Salmonella enterica]EJD1942473.1 DNA cytosine methyltransferase [Escherichia coli]EHF0215352.1 DNA cytosine methyltransferase [Salmonella enterica]EJH8717620.1 DNA cytosine methyltransferase [Escherichia coli]EJM1834539.1 DNA cytosine methyltransferase [Salmonella enterica]
MTAYYNEFNSYAADWLRELIAAGVIPQGDVDERSIEEVRPEDLAGYTQCHFFAGIAGWPLALRLAGVPDTRPVWTGSPPCQGFSVAGKQLGFSDERHLAPQFLALIGQCKPPVIFGEQVSAAIATGWWDFVQAHLEEEDYACGMAVLPASGIGAPHKRERLFFGADRLAVANHHDDQRAITAGDGETRSATGCNWPNVIKPWKPCRTSHAHAGRMAYADCERLQREWPNCDAQGREGQDLRPSGLCDRTGAGYWSDAEWVKCRDGKHRPIEPKSSPLAHGFSRSVGLLQPELSRMANRNRNGRLKGYGNAINVRLAAEFVTSYLEAMGNE